LRDGELASESVTKRTVSGVCVSERDVDAELVARVQRGDRQAFDLLVLKYQRKIIRLLSRMIRDPAEIEDVAQEAFIKAYRALPQFRGDSAFYTWLYRIAINTARNWLATNKRRPTNSFVQENEDGETFDESDNLTDNSTPESELASRQIAQTVNELRRHCAEYELSDRDSSVTDFQGA
jgi:RNA polymerase sigma-70 factor (ECF subfamily)